MEYQDLLLRFVGRLVCVSTFGHVKLWGRLAAVTDDCLRLVNTSLSGESDDPWLVQQQFNNAEGTSLSRNAETLVHFHHVVAISCVDDDIPDFHATAKSRNPEAGNASWRVDDRSPSPSSLEPLELDDPHHLLRVERLEVRAGSELIALADTEQGGDLADRFAHLRNLISQQLGFVLPAVHMRDDVRCGPEEYRICVHGAEVARSTLRIGKLLALAGPNVTQPLAGERSSEPTYGQSAVWIEPEQRAEAEKAGYFTVEPGTVLTTHLQQQVRRHAAQLFSIDAMRQLLDFTRRHAPAAVEEAVSQRVPLPRLHDLLTRLLEEEVPLRPLEFILEKVSQLDHQFPEVEELLVRIRTSLGRIICERFRNPAGQIGLVTFDRVLHEQLACVLLDDPQPGSGEWLARFVDELCAWRMEHREQTGRELVLVVDTSLRRKLWSLLHQAIPDVHVISFAEIAQDLPVRVIASLTPRSLGMASAQPRKKSSRVAKAKAVRNPASSEKPALAKPSQPR